MSYRLLVRREAELDLRRAARWYEEQSPGLGRELIAQVDTALNRVANNPNRCQIIYRDVRREIVQRFPYGIFYRIDGTDVVVFAIVHLHRDPSTWQRRV